MGVKIQLKVPDKTDYNYIIAGRFDTTSYILQGNKLQLNADSDGIKILNEYPDTWEAAYIAYKEDIQQIVNDILADKKWLRTINKVSPVQGRLFITGGNCMGVGRIRPKSSSTDESTNSLHTLAIQVLCEKASDTISSKSIDELNRYTMCIYHYLNAITHELLNTKVPYGIYQRYLAVQAYWNNFVYKQYIDVEVVGTLDGIFINLSYNNYSCKNAKVQFDVDIKVGQIPYMTVFGIFLDETCANMNSEDYRIERDFTSSEGKSTGVIDITDPNNCKYEFDTSSEAAKAKCASAWWSEGKIHCEANLEPHSSTKSVFSIRKNSAVVGYTKREGKLNATITVTCKACEYTKSESSAFQTVFEETFERSCSALVPGEVTKEATVIEALDPHYNPMGGEM